MSKFFQQKGKSLLINLMLALFAVTMLIILSFTSYDIVNRLGQYQQARKEYTQLRYELGVIKYEIYEEQPVKDYDEVYKSAWQTEIYAIISANSNVIAWLEVPNSPINYPIVQGDDNCWYLYHTISGQNNPSGSIFLDYRNNSNFRNLHSIIYGHNMRDGSMFAGLHNWYGDVFFIHTAEASLKFEVFNREIVCQYDTLFILPGIVLDDALVVTLSTCVSGNDDLRYVVQGRR